MKAIIFDLDGVVADTTPAHFRSWQRLAREEGIPFSIADYKQLLGRTREDSLRLLANGLVNEPATFSDWLDRKQAYFLKDMESMTPADILPGVVSLLDEAEREGIALGLASSSRNARAVLTRLGLIDRFQVIADGATPCPPKPAPDIFLGVAKALGTTPMQSVVVEDSKAGLQAAKAGGFTVITVGVTSISPAHRTNLAGLSLTELFQIAESSRCLA